MLLIALDLILHVQLEYLVNSLARQVEIIHMPLNM